MIHIVTVIQFKHFFQNLLYWTIMSIWTNPYLLFTSGLIAFLMQFFFEISNISKLPLLKNDNINTKTAITRNLNFLQSHPDCGITSGGRKECWWNCTVANFYFIDIFMVIRQYLLGWMYFQL